MSCRRAGWKRRRRSSRLGRRWSPERCSGSAGHGERDAVWRTWCCLFLSAPPRWQRSLGCRRLHPASRTSCPRPLRQRRGLSGASGSFARMRRGLLIGPRPRAGGATVAGLAVPAWRGRASPAFATVINVPDSPQCGVARMRAIARCGSAAGLTCLRWSSSAARAGSVPRPAAPMTAVSHRRFQSCGPVRAAALQPVVGCATILRERLTVQRVGA